NEPADARDTIVVLLGELSAGLLRVDAHRSELEDREELTELARAHLLVEHAAARIELDREHGQAHQQPRDEAADAGDADDEDAYGASRGRPSGEPLGEDELARLELAHVDLPGRSLVEIDALLDLDASELDLEQLIDRQRAASIGVRDQDELDVLAHDDVE